MFNIKERVFNDKGISGVTAILLIIIVVAGAALLLYFWIFGFLGSMETEAESGSDKIRVYVKIEGIEPNLFDPASCISPDVACYDAKYYCYLVRVRNIGDETVYIKDLYVLDSISGVAVWYSIWTGGGYIRPGMVEYLTLSIPCDRVVSGKYYIIRLTLTNGYQAHYTCKLRG